MPWPPGSDPFKTKVERPDANEGRRDRVPLGRTGADMARDGYSVLERADRTDPYNRHLKPGSRVTDDGPDFG